MARFVNAMKIHVCTPKRFCDKISKMYMLFQIIRQEGRALTFLSPLFSLPPFTRKRTQYIKVKQFLHWSFSLSIIYYSLRTCFRVALIGSLEEKCVQNCAADAGSKY